MIPPANQPYYRPVSDASGVIVLRCGNPRYRHLRETYHQLRRQLRSVRMRGDPDSRAVAARLDRARLILLDALVVKEGLAGYSG